MGFLRLYLALSVVADHAGPILPWQMHNGGQAVQIFYIISGFYMALVLSRRYGKPRDFYLSRFLRIFPPYWMVLAATLVLSLVSGLIFNRWLMLRTYINHPLAHNGHAGIALAALLNLTLIGQDWLMFLKHDLGQSLQFTANFWNDRSPLWRFLLLPQSWSIGVELIFYACAPFLNRVRTPWLAGIAIGSYAARVWAYRKLGLAHDPWEYRFFPFELGLFVIGMLGYRCYAKLVARRTAPEWKRAFSLQYLIGAAAVLLVMYLHVRFVGYLGGIITPDGAVLVTYPLFIIGVPGLFYAFGKNRIDRFIGELSYPVYLIHYLVIVVVANLLNPGIGPELGRISGIASVIVAAAFYHFVIVRLDKKRHDLSIKSAKERSAANEESGDGSAVLYPKR